MRTPILPLAALPAPANAHTAGDVARPLSFDVLLDGRPIGHQRFELRGEGLDITLAYVRDGEEWMALDSMVAGGRTLQYRRSAADLPRGSTP